MQISPPGANPYAAATAQPAAASNAPSAKSGADPVADFLNFVGKTPAEQMRAEILHELGVTEDQLKAMDPKERLKIETKIKELVKEKVQEATEQKTGLAVDIKV